MKKRRSLYQLPSYCLRLLALPCLCRTATQKPTLVYAIRVRIYLSRDTIPEARYYTTLGIYRCSILDIDTKLCENFKQSRISADKRFSNM
ncbi:MAG: hypothetical protein K2K25_06820 [Muribaculaceae bacterium]|nr:hypothetical protein [Muribaculaceae bacterium]